jgi:hypothetical protein
MRLARNHPALTAQEWFNHILFADELGNPPVRAPGELRDLLVAALSGRNYRFDTLPAATFTLKANGQEILSSGPGSRGQPIPLSPKADEITTYNMSVSLKSTESYKFQYPVKVRVQLRDGPIQGAVHWQGEETQPIDYVLNNESETANFNLSALGKCDEINRDDGSCVDFAYIQIWNKDATRPSAKKRFYLRIKTQNR